MSDETVPDTAATSGPTSPCPDCTMHARRMQLIGVAAGAVLGAAACWVIVDSRRR